MLIGRQIHEFDTLDSTNNFVANMLESGLYLEGDVIMAHFQTKGRGQRGNHWLTSPGKNLLISFAINSSFLALQERFLLSKATSVAVMRFLKHYGLARARIKWPNDILINDRKICGFLLETRSIQSTPFSIMGIGINVNETDFYEIPKATSMMLELGYELTLRSALSSLIEVLNSQYALLRRKCYHRIHTDYMTCLYGTDEMATFVERQNTYKGKIVNVTHAGHLCVESELGDWQKYSSGEVKITY